MLLNIQIHIFKCLDYAVFNESWENKVEISYHKHMDKKKIFLMELYAWSKMFHQKSGELLELLSYKGNLFNI